MYAGFFIVFSVFLLESLYSMVLMLDTPFQSTARGSRWHLNSSFGDMKVFFLLVFCSVTKRGEKGIDNMINSVLRRVFAKEPWL